MTFIKINNKIISKNSSIFTVAEIGINHNGVFNRAIKMIDYAKDAMFDAVKFQTFVPDLMLKKNTSLANYQKKTGYGNQFEMLKKNSLTFDEFEKLSKYCKKKKIIFLSTPFDIKSANFLKKLNMPAYKISSGDNDNYLLLDHIKNFDKPIILSTGMIDTKNLKKTLNHLKLRKNKLLLTHCVSSYPTNLRDSYLSNILTLKKLPYLYGYSDHTIGDQAIFCSISLGIKLIEKHITLDKYDNGPDHYCSMECKDLKKFITNIKDIEISIKNKTRFLTKEEISTKKIAKKSIYLNLNLKKNNIINKKHLIPLRPLQNGIPINQYQKIIGKRINKDKKKFSQLKYNDLY